MESSNPQQDLRVLVADDDVTTRMLLRTAMKQWGYQVLEASDGEEAWEIISKDENPPQLLIFDWVMPKLNGLELCERVRQSNLGFFYIILLTQLTGGANFNKALESGADEFLSKPFNMAELRNRLLIACRMIQYVNEIVKQQKIVRSLYKSSKAVSEAMQAMSPQHHQWPDEIRKAFESNIVQFENDLTKLESSIDFFKKGIGKN